MRKPQAFLNYNGELSDQIGVVMGPNTLGERLTVVSQEYDSLTDRTRLGLVYGLVKSE